MLQQNIGQLARPEAAQQIAEEVLSLVKIPKTKNRRMTRFKKIARNLLTVLLLLGAVAFAELRRPQRVCQRLVVEVQTDGARFITPEDVRLLVTQAANYSPGRSEAQRY